MQSGSLLLVLNVVAPLGFGVGSLLLFGRTLRPLVLAGLIAMPMLAAGLALADPGGVVVHRMGGWGAPLGIELRADGISMFMVLLTALVGSLAGGYALTYFCGGDAEHERERAFFWPLWFMLWGGLNGLFLTGDLFNLYVTLELVNLSAVALVALPMKPASIRASIRYLTLALMGSMCFLFGCAVAYAEFGTLDLQLLGAAIVHGGAASLAAALLLSGLIMKAAIFPLHFWLPPAHALAPAPVSAALSGLVVAAAVYGVFRLWTGVVEQVAGTAVVQVLGGLGALAVAWGSLQALRQERMKLMLAYSTVAQLGYLFIGFALAHGETGALEAWKGAWYFLFAHGCAKAAAFLAAGGLLVMQGSDRLGDLHGAGVKFPMLMMAFALAAANLIGLPPSGGFIAKWMLLSSAYAQGAWILFAVMIAGSLFAMAYLFRFLEVAMREDQNRPLHREAVPHGLRWPALALAGVSMVLGLFSAWPLRLLDAAIQKGML